MVDESDGMRRRVRAAGSRYFVLAAQARKLSPSESLGCVEGALKRRARSRDGVEAIELCHVFCSMGRFWCSLADRAG